MIRIMVSVFAAMCIAAAAETDDLEVNNFDENTSEENVIETVEEAEEIVHTIPIAPIKTIADFDAMIALDENDTKAYSDRGYLYRKLGDYKKAAQDARKACELGDCRLLTALDMQGMIGD